VKALNTSFPLFRSDMVMFTKAIGQPRSFHYRKRNDIFI